MASDTDAQAIIDEIMASLQQLRRLGVPVKESDDVKGKPAAWIGIGGTRWDHGRLVFDSAALLELQPQH